MRANARGGCLHHSVLQLPRVAGSAMAAHPGADPGQGSPPSSADTSQSGDILLNGGPWAGEGMASERCLTGCYGRGPAPLATSSCRQLAPNLNKGGALHFWALAHRSETDIVAIEFDGLGRYHRRPVSVRIKSPLPSALAK